jgi:methionine aminopeptidase
VEGVLSHQLKQFVIDGNKVVLSVSNADTKVDDAEFEENEVYAIDIVTSTGEGKVSDSVICICCSFFSLFDHVFVEYSWQPKLLDEKQTTIYKRAVDKNYHLKMKASRFIFSEISQKFPIMPFTARFVTAQRFLIFEVFYFCCVLKHELMNCYRALEEKRARLGLVECMNHELLQPYPVLHEKPGRDIPPITTGHTIASY